MTLQRILCAGYVVTLVVPLSQMQCGVSWRIRKATQPRSVLRSLKETPHEFIEQEAQGD